MQNNHVGNLKHYQLISMGNYIKLLPGDTNIDFLGVNSTYGMFYDVGVRNVLIELSQASVFGSQNDMTLDIADVNKTKLLRVYFKFKKDTCITFPVVYYLRTGGILARGPSFDLPFGSCGPFRFCRYGCCYKIGNKRFPVYDFSRGDLFLAVYQGLDQNKFIPLKERLSQCDDKENEPYIRGLRDITSIIVSYLL